MLPIQFGIQSPFYHSDSHRTTFHNGFTPIHRLVFQLFEGNHFIDHSHFFGFFGCILPTKKPDLTCFFLSDTTSQIRRTKSSVETPYFRSGLSETGILGSDSQITDYMQHMPASDSITVDHSDHRFGK